MKAERVGVGGERVDIDETGRVVDEVAPGDVDGWVERVDIDQQAGPGVHRRVPGKRAVTDGRRRQEAAQRETTLVAFERRGLDVNGDA